MKDAALQNRLFYIGNIVFIDFIFIHIYCIYTLTQAISTAVPCHLGISL